MRFIRKIWLDLRMGKCSGFPNCCISWYVTGWKLIFGKTTETLWDKPDWRVRLILWYHDKAGGAQYIPCPLCLISGARVRVRTCTPECGHREESQRLHRRPYVRDR